MIESVHCPNCAAHYALRPSRVQRRHRRALCFNCDKVFSIQEEVHRLCPEEDLFNGSEEAIITSERPSFFLDAVGTEPTGPLPEMEYREAVTPQPLPDELGLTLEPQALGQEEALHILPEPQYSMPEEQYPLTLGDLEEPDSSLERTLILNPAGHPELRALPKPPSHTPEELEALGLGPGEPSPSAPPAEPQPSEEAEGTATYSSARDAIDKLLSGTPAPQRVRPMSMSRPGAQMDVESTLDALEATLGGNHALAAMEEAPGSTVALSHRELDRAMASQTAEPEPSASTRLLNIADLPQALPPAMEATLMMPRPPMEAPPFSPAPAPSFPSAAAIQGPPPTAGQAQDPNLLKVQLEQDTLSNVGMEQLILLVEQGRVKEYHMVARQFSENWLEASKVPALRPVFERLRRITQMGPAPTLTTETAPVKKSLFGGLFGGKN